MASGKGIRAGKVFVEIFGEDGRLQRTLARVRAKLKAFGASVRQIGVRLFAVGAAAAAALSVPIKIFSSFSDQMAVVRAVTGATEKEFDILNEKAKELGRTTSFTASQVAAAMTELGRAGFRPGEIDNAIASVLDLARATDTDLAEAAGIASATLRGFQIDTADSKRVMDVLSVAANSSATTLTDLGEGLKFVAPIASEAGESLEDTAAAMGVLANNGLRGTIAGTSLARAFKNLAKENLQKQLTDLGISAVDATGNLRPVAAILTELGQKTAEFGTAKRLAIFEEIFGRGQAAALKLASSAAVFDDLQEKLNDSGGAAARTAKQMDNTLGGSFRMLLSAAEGVAIAIGEGLSSTLRSAASALTTIAGHITKFSQKNPGLIKTIAMVTAGVTAAGVALVILGTVLSSVGTIVGVFGTAFSVVSGILGFLVSPLGLILAGVGLLGAVLIKTKVLGSEAFGALKELFAGFAGDVKSALGAIGAALGRGDIKAAFAVLTSFLKLEWQRVKLFLIENLPVKDLVEAFFEIRRAFAEMTAGIKTLWSDAVGFLATTIAKSGVFGEVDPEDIADIDKQRQTRNQRIGASLNEALNRIEESRKKAIAGVDLATVQKDFEAAKRAFESSKRQAQEAEKKEEEEKKKEQGTKQRGATLDTAAAASREFIRNRSLTTATSLFGSTGQERVLAAIQGVRGVDPQQQTARGVRDLVEQGKQSLELQRKQLDAAEEKPEVVEIG